MLTVYHICDFLLCVYIYKYTHTHTLYIYVTVAPLVRADSCVFVVSPQLLFRAPSRLDLDYFFVGLMGSQKKRRSLERPSLEYICSVWSPFKNINGTKVEKSNDQMEKV